LGRGHVACDGGVSEGKGVSLKKCLTKVLIFVMIANGEIRLTLPRLELTDTIVVEWRRKHVYQY